MVSIERYTHNRQDEAALLSVKAHQVEFTVSDVPETVVGLSEDEHPHLIINDNKAVGFFLLDLGYSEKYHFSKDKAIGVRALLIDQEYQGKGIAKSAIKSLVSYVRNNYSEFEAIQLTVNCRNISAYQCYLKSGFEDTGTLYHGGPVGPQHIMQVQLKR